jgi:hypothetical protein
MPFRQVFTSMLGLAAIVVVPAVAIFYARRRWRP